MTAAPVIAEVARGAFAKPHKATLSLFWRGAPLEVEKVSRTAAWPRFHRECGKHGLFFNDIDPVDRRRNFQALAYRLERGRSWYTRFAVSDGRGPGPVEACIDAVRKAVEAGFPIPLSVIDIFVEKPAAPDVDALLGLTSPAPQPVIDIAGLLG